MSQPRWPGRLGFTGYKFLLLSILAIAAQTNLRGSDYILLFLRHWSTRSRWRRNWGCARRRRLCAHSWWWRSSAHCHCAHDWLGHLVRDRRDRSEIHIDASQVVIIQVLEPHPWHWRHDRAAFTHMLAGADRAHERLL